MHAKIPEASEVVTLEQRVGIEDSPGNVGHVQAGESVDRSGIAPELEGSWVLERVNISGISASPDEEELTAR